MNSERGDHTSALSYEGKIGNNGRITWHPRLAACRSPAVVHGGDPQRPPFVPAYNRRDNTGLLKLSLKANAQAIMLKLNFC